MKRQRPCGSDRAVRIEDGDARGVQEVAQAEEGPKGCVWIVAQLEGRLRGAHRGRQAGRASSMRMAEGQRQQQALRWRVCPRWGRSRICGAATS